MPEFDADREPITVFDLDDRYLFSHYFDRTDVFRDLREYYDDDNYRFEVPVDEFDAVREVLENAYYEPDVVEDLEPYCVVKEQYTEHADILRNSVLHWSRNGFNFFLLKDQPSVREAVEAGATPIEESEFVLGL